MKLTDKEKSKILDDMVIICDSREQKNQHILEYLKTNNIPYIIDKLDTADYTFILPSYPELNLDKHFLVERKNSLSELAGNFTKGRDRFKREFERAESNKIHLVVETATFRKLFNGSYRSKFNPKSYLASLLTWNIRYDCPVWFAETKESPTLIYAILFYELKEFLNNFEKNS